MQALKNSMVRLAVVGVCFGLANQSQAATTTSYFEGSQSGTYVGDQKDTYIREVSPTTNYNAGGFLLSSVWAEANPDERTTLVSFEALDTALINLLPGDVIESATLKMYAFSFGSNSVDGPAPAIDPNPISVDGLLTLPVSGLLRPFTDNEATWNEASTGTAWTTPGARAVGASQSDFDTGSDRAPVDSVTVLDYSNVFDTYVDFDVTASLQAQVDAGKFYGWVLGDVTGISANDGTIIFRDRENPPGPNSSRDPILEVTFSIPGDFDDNGNVAGSDFLLWQRNTSIGNLADWEANFGRGGLLPLTAISAAGTTVPEPTTTVLLSFAMAAAAMPRRCRSFEFSHT